MWQCGAVVRELLHACTCRRTGFDSRRRYFLFLCIVCLFVFFLFILWVLVRFFLLACRKIPKISPGTYIFQRPFLEGPIFGGAYVWREICVSKSIELACRFSAQSLTNTFHYLLLSTLPAKRTLKGFIWGSTSSEELKVRTM